jgi:iron complex outermembrane receptor protein
MLDRPFPRFAAAEPKYRKNNIARFLRVLLAGLSIALGAVGLAKSSSAQQAPSPTVPLKQLTLDQLANLDVVTVSKETELLQQIPAAVYVLTQEDIRRSGASSLPEVLRLVPGVEIARIDSSKWSVGIRGFAGRLSRSMLVLIDGRSVYTPLFAGVYWEVQDTLLEDIERIEVIRGPGGTVWGANAVNGVINIITKSAAQTHGWFATAGGGNVDQGMFGFRYGNAHRDVNYRIYAKGFTRGPQFHAGASQYDDWRMAQGGFRTDWTFSNRDTLTVQGDLYQGEAGHRLQISEYSPPSINFFEANSDLSGSNLLARWTRPLAASGSSVEVLAYYDRANRQDLNFAEIRNTFDADFIHRHAFLQGRHNLTWGVGARFSAGDTTAVVPTVIFDPEDFTDKIYTAFVRNHIALVPNRLWMEVGSKFLHNNYTGFEAQPRGSLLWAITPQQSLWTSFTRAVRTPSRVDAHLRFTALFLPALPAFLRLTGTESFLSENMLGYEAGYRAYLASTLLLDISVFYNDYDDLLSVEANTPFTEPEPPPPHVVLPVLANNLVRGSTSGGEIAATWEANTRWRLKSGYSYLNMNLENKPGSIDGSTVRMTEGSSPRHQVFVQSFLWLPRNFEFDTTYRYAGALSAVGVPSYSTADVRFGWAPAEHIEFSLSGRDLLQRHHRESGSVGIKRSVYAAITWRR